MDTKKEHGGFIGRVQVGFNCLRSAPELSRVSKMFAVSKVVSYNLPVLKKNGKDATLPPIMQWTMDRRADNGVGLLPSVHQHLVRSEAAPSEKMSEWSGRERSTLQWHGSFFLSFDYCKSKCLL